MHIERRLVVCPRIRGTDLHAELRGDYGYQGSYHTFQRQLGLLRPAVVRDPEIRFETGPGLQTQADWAHLGLWQLGDAMVQLYAMVAILGCSRAPTIRFATDTTRETSFGALVRCLDDLGGVTREILTDRDPAFCIGATGCGATRSSQMPGGPYECYFRKVEALRSPRTPGRGSRLAISPRQIPFDALQRWPLRLYHHFRQSMSFIRRMPLCSSHSQSATSRYGRRTKNCRMKRRILATATRILWTRRRGCRRLGDEVEAGGYYKTYRGAFRRRWC